MNYSTVSKTLLFLFLVSFINLSSLFSQEKKDSIHVDLQKALEIAMSESPTMRIAERDVQVKKYYKKEQIVSLFPDVSLAASYNRTIKKQKMTMGLGGQPVEIEVGTYNNYTAGLSLSLPIIMPTLWYNLKLSQLDVELALESSRSSKISLINEVKKAYYTYLYAKESYEVLLATYANVELSNKLVTDKYEQGLASEFDKLRADVQLKNQRPNITAAKNATELASMMLKVLMGVDASEPIIFDGTLTDFEANMLSRMVPTADSLSLINNTSLIQLDIAKKQLESARKMMISSSAPSLALGGNYQYMTMSDHFKFSDYKWFPYSVIGLSLNVPIVSWAATSYKMKQNRLSQENLADQKLDVQRNLEVSIISNINNIEKSIEDYLSNKESVMQAERAQAISQKQYEIGMATWLDLSSAELALNNARLAYKQSIYNYVTAYAALEAVLGVMN
ncbi:MAG: TolC family protein [Bacteroidales bacterium]